MRIAVTGITGTVGLALGTLAQRDPRVDELVGLGRREFAPASARGWTKCTYVRADIRDRDALERAFAGADVVIHLAFALYGVRMSLAELSDVNVGGTANAFEAARRAGVKRFVHASSAATYGVGELPERPIREDAPIRADARHFYAEHKTRAEQVLQEAAAAPGAPELVMLRPVGIAGPHAVSAATQHWPAPLRRAAIVAFGAGLRPPLPPPPVLLQVLHPADAASAFLTAAFEGPPGIYNVAPDDVLPGADVIRGLGFPIARLPMGARRAGLRALNALPVPVPAWSWLEMLRASYVLDTTKIRETLGWRPRHTSRDALAVTRAGWSA
jgi:nucleoside-diphosphate-sugar epimerase